ncbi:MAG: RNA polymerase sigma factor RpoH [Brachymonas sp.]
MSGALTLANNNWAATALMPSLGNLDAYISAANRMPLLTLEEEQRYAKQWRDEQNMDAAGRLVLSHLRLVISTARQYLGYGLPHADLIQEGNVGLMKAVKRFDPDQGVRLVSYALHWIKAEIHEHILKNFRMIKVATTKAQRKLFFNLRSMKQGFKHDASEADDGLTHRDSLSAKEIDTVARTLNVKREDVIEMEARFAGGDVLLDPTPMEGEDSDHAFGPIAYLSDSSMEPTAQLEARERDHLAGDGVLAALEQLDPRSRRIIEERWLKVNDNGSGGLTLHDLAAEYGVSAERIRQIEAAAMKKMKKLLAA